MVDWVRFAKCAISIARPARMGLAGFRAWPAFSKLTGWGGHGGSTFLCRFQYGRRVFELEASEILSD